jgi:uncharacterized protein (TIGR02271 family)
MAGEKHAPGMSAETRAVIPQDELAIPLLEERLSITKRQVEAGRVRVRVNVEEREETVTEELLRDDVLVERVSKGIRVTEVPRVRFEGNTTVVPVVKETVVVEKALVLVEEIHITRHPVSEPHEIPVKLRTERARIEREPASGPSAAEE